MRLPPADIITYKHCGAPVAIIPRLAIVGRTPLECQACKVITVAWPLQRPREGVEETPTTIGVNNPS